MGLSSCFLIHRSRIGVTSNFNFLWKNYDFYCEIKMSLYPSLEDMQVDHMVQAQTNLLGPTRPPGTANAVQAMYPGLADYMGLELTQDVIRANMPEYLEQNRTTAMIRRPS